MSTLASTIGRGVTGSRPAASEAGRLYYDTTVAILYRDNGSSWDSCSPTALTDPTTTRGDLIVRGAATLGRLALGAAGKAPVSDGTDLIAAYPPGYEFDYVQFTGASVSITHTTEATADTIVTANAVTFDGATAVMIEFYAFAARPDGTAAAILSYYLYDGAASIGRIGAHSTPAASNNYIPTILRRKLTPSAAAHTYSIRGATSSGTGIILAGAGGNAADMPGYIRITKV